MNLVVIKDIASKYIVAILVGLTLSVAGLIREAYHSIVAVPAQIREAKLQHTQDSARAAIYMNVTDERLSRLELTQDVQAEQIANGQKFDERVKTKFKIK